LLANADNHPAPQTKAMTSIGSAPPSTLRTASAAPKESGPVKTVCTFDTRQPGTTYRADRALAMAQLAAIAYDEPADIEAKLAASGLTLHGFYSAQGKVGVVGGVDSQALVATTDDAVVLAFRGTSSELDILTDGAVVGRNRLSFGQTTALVHRGFANALTALEGGLLDTDGAAIPVWRTAGAKANPLDRELALFEQVKKLVDGPPKRKLYITGHSLGGALATLAALKLEMAGTSPEAVYTIGSPRPAGTAFASQYDGRLKDRTFTHINFSDIVPRVPFDKGILEDLGFDWSQDAADLLQKLTTLKTEPGRYVPTQFRRVGTVKYMMEDGQLADSPPGFWQQVRDWAWSAVKEELGTVKRHSSDRYVEGLAKLAAQPPRSAITADTFEPAGPTSADRRPR
jgi:hypothetical protein